MRHFYAAAYDSRGELRDVIRYDDRKSKDYEVKYSRCGALLMEPVTSREAARKTRELFGLLPYEGFYGEIAWVRPVCNCDFPGTAPEILTHR